MIFNLWFYQCVCRILNCVSHWYISHSVSMLSGVCAKLIGSYIGFTIGTKLRLHFNNGGIDCVLVLIRSMLKLLHVIS